MEQNSNSTLNTVLIILLVLVALVLGGWAYRAYFAGGVDRTPTDTNQDTGGSLNVDVQIPTGGDNNGSASGAGEASQQ